MAEYPYYPLMYIPDDATEQEVADASTWQWLRTYEQRMQDYLDRKG